MNFRYDINGLRAYAVIAVVIYHFSSSWLPGGFIGVDVFFVISGYLMTKIIYTAIESRQFSLLSFYHARAKRILPALTVLCLSLLLAGYFYLNSLDLLALSKHAAASIGFLSNMLYLFESNYFDPVSHEKWLLHTWSLSVEWQFYLIYPILLALVAKTFSLKALRPFVILLTLSCFYACIKVVSIEPSNAFYFLPTRAWELTIGGLAFLFPLTLSRSHSQSLEVLGLSAIIASYCFIDQNDLWPGYLTCIAVLGTFLVIQANRQQSILTNNNLCQEVGKYSFSLYLWHWPVIVFLVYEGLNTTLSYQLLGIALSFILAWCSFKFIESPQVFRTSSALYLLPILTIGLCFYIGSQASNSIPKKPVPAYKYFDQTTCQSLLQQFPSQLTLCKKYGASEDLDFVIWGDSHAQELGEFLALQGQYNFIVFSNLGCPPLIEVNRADNTSLARYCTTETNHKIFNKIQSLNPQRVMLIARWNIYNQGWIKNAELQKATHFLCKDDCSNVTAESSSKALEFGFKKTVIELAKFTHLDVFLSIPVQKISGKNYLRRRRPEDLLLTKNEHKSQHARITNMIEQYQAVTDYRIFDPSIGLCETGLCLLEKNKTLLYMDDNHLTIQGWKTIKSELINFIEHEGSQSKKAMNKRYSLDK